MKLIQEGLTFDDVLLLPRHSEVLPKDVCLTIRLTSEIELKSPLVSAAMDTVTEAKLAIALAQEGGLGIIHKNMPIQTQITEVKKVKNFENGVLRNADLITAKDLQKAKEKPLTSKDKRGQLRVGAAIGVGPDAKERAIALIEAGADILCIDTAHGHSQQVIDSVRWLKKEHPEIPLIAGNIATADAAEALANAGADVIKVGVGPGSICTTRIITGVGVPQITAIMQVANALQGRPVSIIADGGIRYSGDLCKALAAGAQAVMIGSLFAGTEEAPGKIELYQGQSYKTYRGMGSLGAMQQGSSDRYFQESSESSKLVPEGIEGRIPYKGPLPTIIHYLLGGVRAGMGYLGSRTIPELHQKAQFIKLTAAGMRESHVHNVNMSKEAPNYFREN